MSKQNEKYFMSASVALAMAVRITYGFTRNIFESGPDANTYIQMAKDLSDKGYFSDGVAGFPIYPPGYAMFLAFNKFIFGNNWIYLVQIEQSIMTILTAVIGFYLANKILPRRYAQLVFLTLLFHPALIVLSVSCMYESLLLYILFALIKIVQESFCKKTKSSLFALLGALAILIHPRSIPIIILITMLFIQKSEKRIRIITITSSILLNSLIIVIVIIRNNTYSNFVGFNAGTIFGIEFGHPSVGRCSHIIACLTNGLTNNPLLFVREGLINVVYFLSPWTGPNERGTWFHNLSIYQILKQIPENFFVIFNFAQSIGIILFIIMGFCKSWKMNPIINKISLGMFLILMITEFLVYGDSRHKILLMPSASIYFYFFVFRLTEYIQKMTSKKVNHAYTLDE